MSRDSTGNYTSPSGPFVSGTIINSSVMNQKLTDLGDEITNSLDRNGKGDMLAPILVPDGTNNLPGYGFSSEATLGFWRAATGQINATSNGTALQKWSTTEVRVYNAFKVSAGGAVIDAGGLTVTAGGATVTAGGLTVTAGTTVLGGGVTGPSSGALVVDNGLTITTGGIGVTAGDITWGTTGSVIGAAPAQGGVSGANTLEATGALSGTSGHSHALTTAAKFNAGGNTGRLNLRSSNRTTVVDWHEVRAGLSYDVDSSVGVGGALYFSFTEGLRATAATAATTADTAACLELTNGNLKLSGASPGPTVGVSNTLTPKGIVKAWGAVQTTGGGSTTATVVSGLNVASAAVSTTDLDITLATALASTSDAAPVANVQINGMLCSAWMTTSSILRVNCYPAGSGTAFDLQAGGSRTITFIVFGTQT